VQNEFQDPLTCGPIQTAHFPLFFSVFSGWAEPNLENDNVFLLLENDNV
jgi:hypothetical protein